MNIKQHNLSRNCNTLTLHKSYCRLASLCLCGLCSCLTSLSFRGLLCGWWIYLIRVCQLQVKLRVGVGFIENRASWYIIQSILFDRITQSLIMRHLVIGCIRAVRWLTKTEEEVQLISILEMGVNIFLPVTDTLLHNLIIWEVAVRSIIKTSALLSIFFPSGEEGSRLDILEGPNITILLAAWEP